MVSDVILAVSNLTVRYGGVTAVDDVDIAIHQGSLVGLIGPNGAGKSSLIDAVTGFASYSGKVCLNSESLDGLGPHKRQHKGMVRTFQQAELFEDLTVIENLRIGASGTPVKRGFRRRFTRNRSDDDGPFSAIIDLLDLDAIKEITPNRLSQGQRKLVSVGRALASKPQLVLLDEPAAGLDSAESRQLGLKLRAICDQGTTILLIEHDMSLVFEICDLIEVLDVGQIIASGVPSSIRHHPAVVAAYLGT
jgi:ABC-type branched-subunit amino acid transport system ATPase component